MAAAHHDTQKRDRARLFARLRTMLALAAPTLATAKVLAPPPSTPPDRRPGIIAVHIERRCSLAILASVLSRFQIPPLGHHSGPIAIVNAANNDTPGGGVKYGASAQEEALCRHTTLFASLDGAHRHGLYPLHGEGHLAPCATALLTTGVRFVRPTAAALAATPNNAFLDERLCAEPGEAKPQGPYFAVVSLAAPMRARLGSTPPYADVTRVMTERFRAMWAAARQAGIRTLVLPLPGCGSFSYFPGTHEPDAAFVDAVAAGLAASMADAPPGLRVMIPDMYPEVMAALVRHRVFVRAG